MPIKYLDQKKTALHDQTALSWDPISLYQTPRSFPVGFILLSEDYHMPPVYAFGQYFRINNDLVDSMIS